MSGIDRMQTLRIDCPDCVSKGYIQKGAEQELCQRCGGSGMLERDVPFKFETGGKWDKDDVASAFEISPDQVVDRGHDGGEPNTARAVEED